MKKTYLKSFCARCLTLLVLALLSTNLAWGKETELSESLDLTGKTAGIAAYNSSLTYGDWTIVNGANNNKGWAYFKMGGKSATISTSNPCYIYYSANTGVSSKVDKIVVHIVDGSLGTNGMSVNSWGVYVYSDQTMSNQIDYVAGGTITKNAADFEFTPSAGKTWAAGYYYKVSWDLANTSGTNGIVWLDKITLQSINDAPEPVLQSIAISGNPTKTTYEVGEEFDPAGLVVTGTYSDDSEETITSGITWTFDPEVFALGDKTVSVTAKVGDFTSEAFTVNNIVVKERTYASTYTSNVELSTEGGTKASSAKVIIDGTTYENAIKAGTGDVAGAVVVTIPANTKTLHFHAAGWKGETVVLNKTFELVADAGVNSSSPFTLQNDPEEKDYFTLDPNGATSITFTATSGKRFVLFGVNAELFETKDVEITDAKYATLGLPYAVTIPEGVSAYTATVEGTTVTMTKIQTGVIPAECGVILYAETPKTYTFTETTTNESYEDNQLVAVVSGPYTCTEADKDLVYYLGKDGDGSAIFKKLNLGGTIAAGKAYLKLDEALSGNAKLDVTFGEPTGIESLTPALSEGKGVYNLNGMKVNEAYKGIIIVNGKKYINK